MKRNPELKGVQLPQWPSRKNEVPKHKDNEENTLKEVPRYGHFDEPVQPLSEETVVLERYAVCSIYGHNPHTVQRQSSHLRHLSWKELSSNSHTENNDQEV